MTEIDVNKKTFKHNHSDRSHRSRMKYICMDMNFSLNKFLKMMKRWKIRLTGVTILIQNGFKLETSNETEILKDTLRELILEV